MSFAGPGGQVEIVTEHALRGGAGPQVEPGDPTIEQDVAPAEPADATPSEHDAEDEEPPVDDSASASLATNLVWGALTLASVSLAILALVVTVLAIAGMDRVF